MAEPKKMPSGNWRILVYIGKDKSGKKKYKSITAATKREAKRKADQLELSLSKLNVDFNDMTLEQAYDMYIKSKSDVLSPATIAGYERSKRNHFQELMHFKLSKLNQIMIQNAVNSLSATHSSKTVRNAHGLLSAVLKVYYPNLQLRTTLPQKVKPEYIVPTTAEINKLLELANNKVRLPVLLASQGGLRRSEICALTIDDFSEFGVYVNKAAVFDKNKKIIIKTTKTESGTRFVPLPPAVIAEARKWKYFGIKPSTLSSAYERLLEKADVPRFSFHKLRHYYASELHAQGIPDQYIAQYGGWATVDMLHKIYQHTMRDKTDAIAEKVLNIFNSNFQKDNTKDNLQKKKA